MPGGFDHTEVWFQPVDFTSTEVVDLSVVPPLPKQWIHRWLPSHAEAFDFFRGFLFTEVSISPVASYSAEAVNFTVGFHLIPKYSISSLVSPPPKLWFHHGRSVAQAAGRRSFGAVSEPESRSDPRATTPLHWSDKGT
jgi:hypothetical protein